MSSKFPPGVGQLIPGWFRDMSNCGMMILWLALAVGLTLLTNAFAQGLASDIRRYAWFFTALAWGVVLLQAGLCVRDFLRARSAKKGRRPVYLNNSE